MKAVNPVSYPVLCQAAVESGKVTMNAIISVSPGGYSISPLSGMEVHSTTTFNGIAVLHPEDADIQLPATLASAGCAALLHTLAHDIPPSQQRTITLIPFG